MTGQKELMLLKISVKQDSSLNETEVIVKYPQYDSYLDKLLNYIEQFDYSFKAKSGKHTFLVYAKDICYFDSTDGKTFLYTKDKVYDLDSSLAELESKLMGTKFVRISKNCILNISYLQSVSPLWNHRLTAV